MPPHGQSIRRSRLSSKSFFALVALFTAMLPLRTVNAQETAFPQIARVRYEAKDLKTSGNFMNWIDRNRIWHDLGQRLYPAVRYVEIRQVTPSTGSPPIMMVEGRPSELFHAEFYHAAGIVRFKVTNMTLIFTNVPP